MSMSSPEDRQARADREQLQLLAIGYYVVGGITFLFACFALLYVAMGVLVMFSPPKPHGGQPPPFIVGVLLTAFGSFFLLLGWSVAALTLFVGRSIQRQRRRTLTLVVAAIQCAFFPFGTALGVCTFLVLMRDSVMQLYDASAT